MSAARSRRNRVPCDVDAGMRTAGPLRPFAFVLLLAACASGVGALPLCLPECAGAALAGASLVDANLSSANLAGVNLTMRIWQTQT